MKQNRGSVVAILVVFLVLSLAALADQPNYPNDPNGIVPLSATDSNAPAYSFPSNMSVVVYDCGSDDTIHQALSAVGITSYVIRSAATGNHLTAADLSSHNLLIVSWNLGHDTSGLPPEVLASGITGRVLLTGHDLDYHTANGYSAAKTLFEQAINYVASGGGTGMLALGDTSATAFPYLPSSWGVSATGTQGNAIDPITTDGLASGVYDNLTAGMLSGWNTSYHSTFSMTSTSQFSAFEMDGSNVVTVARHQINGLTLTKTDNASSCVTQGNNLTYTISLSYAAGKPQLTGVRLVDTLPPGVDYVSSSPAGEPNAANHTVAWNINTLNAGTNTSITLNVSVNYLADQYDQLHNQVVLSANSGYAIATRDTSVCCAGGTIIYVRADAPDGGNGQSWSTAYNDLHSALRRAGRTCSAKTIWVAQGVYSPGTNPTDSFLVPANVTVYGGFLGCETDPCQRNLDFVKTILDGTQSGFPINNNVVVMNGGAVVNGIVVMGAAQYGVLGATGDFTVEKCIVTANSQSGIRAENSNPIIRWCTIADNGQDGIHAYADTTFISTATIINSTILRNGKDGVYTKRCTPTIKNSVISANGALDKNYWGRIFPGIIVESPASRPLIRNCTLVANAKCAIESIDVNPATTAPEVRNCILWGNGWLPSGYRPQRVGCMGLYYSNVMDGTDPNNCISQPPLFVYGDPNTALGWHLQPTSPCKNVGDPYKSYADEKDIDNENRVYDGTTVDIGADEVTCEDLSNARDWNHDGAVDARELGIFIDAWLARYSSDPNLCSPNWDARADLYTVDNSNGFIDLHDFASFASYYGWHACWHPVISPLVTIQPPASPPGGSDPNIPYDPNTITDPNWPGDPNDPNSYSMLVQGSAMMSLASVDTGSQMTSLGVTVSDLEGLINFLYEAAAECPAEDAAILYNFIPELEAALPESYGTGTIFELSQ